MSKALRRARPGHLVRVVFALAFVVPLMAATLAAAPRSDAANKVTVTMVTDTAGLGDQNFNDLAHKGLLQAQKDLGITPKVIESQDAASYVDNLTNAADGSDLTVGVGFLLTDAMNEVAPQYPDKKFLLIDSVAKPGNVASVTFKEQEGAFLAGVVAGKMTKTNVIGIVGGQKIPPVIRYQVGFEAGVKSVNPHAKILISYADTFQDPAQGKELTLAQYNQRADVVFPIAGRTGVGSFDAAKQMGPGHWIIAADTDQSQLGADYQLCYARKGVGTAVYTVTKEVVDGTFKGGEQVLGLKENGVGLETPGNKVPADVMALVGQYKQAIIAGKFTVPSTEDELKTFTPPTI